MNSDDLAAIRTHLANERTFLAYIRTALAFLATGAALIHFFDTTAFTIAGWAFIGVGAVIAIAGVVRCLGVRRRIK